jgi:hypothetical protein
VVKGASSPVAHISSVVKGTSKLFWQRGKQMTAQLGLFILEVR